MPGPLAGKTVIEVASFIAGPYAGMLLADLGADVIKVEAPGHGDPFRGWDTGGESPAFWAYNRGKRSITLNLRTAAGVEVVHRLAQRADVLLENLRPVGQSSWMIHASKAARRAVPITRSCAMSSRPCSVLAPGTNGWNG